MDNAGAYQSTGSGAWTESGAHPVAPGVHRIPLPLPMDALRAVNVYVVETPQGLTLIDGGWAIPEAREIFEASLRDIGFSIGDIDQFLVTHMHRDHYTLARVIGTEIGAQVSLGIGDKPTMDLMHDDTVDTDPNVTRLELAGAKGIANAWRELMPEGKPDMDPYGMPDTWLDQDIAIDLGSRRLDALSTPGHTQGHYVFADQGGGLLFAGDHVLPTITPSIGFEPAWVQQPLLDFLDSLRKVRELPDLMLLPAHGPVATSTHARIDELLVHHDQRLALCEEAIAGGASTAWDVAGELPWTRRNRRRDELGPFDEVMAAFETLAHLELLALQGRASRVETDGVAHFGVPATQ